MINSISEKQHMVLFF